MTQQGKTSIVSASPKNIKKEPPMVNRITARKRPLSGTSPVRMARVRAALKKIPGLVRLVRLCRLIFHPRYRSEWLLQRTRPDNLFQPYGTTRFDRWPKIFGFIHERLADVPESTLLSFGCSTGEEVFTLRRYFPQAKIVGIDINPRSIAVCQSKLLKSRDKNIQFKQASSTDLESTASYDAIFCMSVLRHGKLGASAPESCEHIIRFSDFEKMVTDLCRCLKPGGYLVLLGSNFRFCDTSIASEFEAVFNTSEIKPSKDTPIYGSNNMKIENGIYSETIFRKKFADRQDAV